MKHFFITVFLFVIGSLSFGQSHTQRILFLGNSYTYVNNLPQMFADVALTTGDTVIFDSNTPGGYTLQGHASNTTSLSKIAMGNWNFVVLQEQSQLPSFPDNQVQTSVYPYAHLLDSVINLHNPCSETVFYMTWGRKNGDASNCASWPPVCTYSGMDSLLNLRYRIMADTNNAILSPVGAVWKYIRANYPSIDLYQADESHPSVAGTYAAACCFYSTIFRKDPTAITFNATLSSTDATNIRTAVKQIVYNSLQTWNIGNYDPVANFNYTLSATNEITFTNVSANATAYNWDFGDGNSSTQVHPVHQYTATGAYTVTLISGSCGKYDTLSQTINTGATVISEINKNKNSLHLYPNPANTILTIECSECMQIKIVNSIGETLFTQSLNEQKTVINIHDLPLGVYIIQNEKGGFKKFVKQ